jgi:transcriptional regulator with XRE-family HTH domain
MSTRRNPRVVFQLRAIRKQRRMTLKEISEQINLSISGLSDLERGQNGLPSADTLVKLCDLLKVKPGQLIEILPPNSP